MRRTFPTVILLALAFPCCASAGTASVSPVPTDPKYGYDEPAMYFQAAAGERNQITVARRAGDFNHATVFALHDAGADVQPGTGCTSADARTVLCDASLAFVDAGDGDDTIALPAAYDGFPVRARGGDGNDVLTGAGYLAGGPGRDTITATADPCQPACHRTVLAGGSGDDVLRGSNGNDLLMGDGDGPGWSLGYDVPLSGDAGAGSDVIDGGGGTDTVSYNGRASGVHIDLGAGFERGAGGERDRLTGIENAAGGEGPDSLLGDDHANVLEGDSGDDRIEGRGGDDYLLGYLMPDTNEDSVGFTQADPGADHLSGGAGDDRLDAGGERGDVLSGGAGDDTLEDQTNDRGTLVKTASCGAGTDVVSFEPHGQLLSDCERINLGAAHAQISARPLRRSGGRLRFATRCVRTNPFHDACKFELALRLRSSSPVVRTVTVPDGTRRSFDVRAPKAPRRGDVVEVALGLGSGTSSARVVRWRARLR
jgi:Ca2+-binding RTX toxin-like protein